MSISYNTNTDEFEQGTLVGNKVKTVRVLE